MKICSVCKRISATDQDHTDCTQKRRIELEDKEQMDNLVEKLSIQTYNPQDLDKDIRAILGQMTRTKDPQID